MKEIISIWFIALLVHTVFGQDLESGGSNSWIFHTPDDGRTTLHIAPKVNGSWNWNAQTIFSNNGRAVYNNNMKIFGTDEAWAQGLAIVKSSGWSGVRLSRNDPAGGNYNGNWALGYNASTGNDFSISANNQGTQYDGLFHISIGTRYVGIGTLSPESRLSISGAEGMLPSLTIRNNSYDGSYSSGTVSMQFAFANHIGPKIEAFKQTNNTTGLRFYTEYGYNVSQLGMTLLPTGNGTNVGIGTNNPTQKLTVNGTIYGKEVKVDLQVPGPDYVFEKDYDLPSLEKVQAYITENKHLPEVPSAKEMEANGINLSEMNMLLLKKIEELTLYILDQRNEIETLKATSIHSKPSQKSIEELTELVKDLHYKVEEQRRMIMRQQNELSALKGK